MTRAWHHTCYCSCLLLLSLQHGQCMKVTVGAEGEVAGAHSIHIQSSRGQPPEARARALLELMTYDEKLSMLHGPLNGDPMGCTNSPRCAYTGNIPPVPRLGIPPINMNDGPQGFRAMTGDRNYTSTAFPSGLAMAATWDPAAIESWGSSQGREFKDKGANVQLGPGVNVARVPWNGRNFEYSSGEDPYLGYVMGKAAVKGIQSQKVMAVGKHWVLNSQEKNRFAIREQASERVMFELYYPPFEGLIEAGVGAMMCSYNKVGEEWACENSHVLNTDLRDQLGFKGFVMSDWYATHSASIDRGLDMEMPGGMYMNEYTIGTGISMGVISDQMLNKSVERILTSMFAVGIMDEPLETWDWSKLANNVTTPESQAEVRRLAAMSTILLKNAGGILPLSSGRKIALIGFAGENVITHCAGSGRVEASRIVTPLEGITAAAGPGSEVTFADGTDPDRTRQIASAADYAIVFIGTRSKEGDDRESLSVDTGCQDCEGNIDKQNDMVRDVVSVNPNTIVVVTVPGAVVLPWSDEVPGLLMNFMPGQEAGTAIADVLFGQVNPSARLPLTIPNVETEIQFMEDQYPGLPVEYPEVVQYKEELLVGYRLYESFDIAFTTGFPFGHGLSYTLFRYEDLIIKASAAGPVLVSFQVRNIGEVPGAEVAQLYITFPVQAREPPKQLKGFHKTSLLQPGASEVVHLELRPRDMSVWCEVNRGWQEVSGQFSVHIGASSRDTRLSGGFDRGI